MKRPEYEAHALIKHHAQQLKQVLDECRLKNGKPRKVMPARALREGLGCTLREAQDVLEHLQC